MKFRSFWLLLFFIIVLIAAYWVDQAKLHDDKVPQLVATLAKGSQVSDSLIACDSSQASSIGPLVPSQDNTGANQDLSDISPADIVPQNERSPRAGFSLSSQTNPEYWAQMLGSGWYIDWAVQSDPPLNGLEHWSMIRVNENCISPSLESIQAAAINFPGQVWIIGNEPDVIWQDNVTASKYAVFYHDLYQVIKSTDPTSLIALGGISQATPLRLKYLDQVLQSYQELYKETMPVDWWTVHGYVLREEKGSWGVDIPPGLDATQGELREVSDHGRIDLFEAQLRSFRQWMADRGYQETPLAVTEFGILMPSSYGFPAEFVIGYLEQTFTWLSQIEDKSIGYPEDAYHLVQKWNWFSLSDPTYSTSDLGDLSSGKLTIVGESFRNIILSLLP